VKTLLADPGGFRAGVKRAIAVVEQADRRTPAGSTGRFFSWWDQLRSLAGYKARDMAHSRKPATWLRTCTIISPIFRNLIKRKKKPFLCPDVEGVHCALERMIDAFRHDVCSAEYA
jgi:hypothetical protein